MKKLSTILFITTVIFFAFNANAQLVTITATNQMAVAGDTIHYVDANTFGFDATGVGPVTSKVWDFSTLINAGTFFYFAYTNPATVPVNLGRDSFPAATVARSQSDAAGYFYYQNTASNVNRIGAYASASNYMIYKGGTFANEFHYPITSGQNYSSTYHGTYSPFNLGEDSVVISGGILTGSADMQGQMILPTGTFNNVLRMHVNETFHVKTWISGMVIQDNVIVDDYYYWFVETVSQPLFIYGITTVDATAQPTVLRYQPIIAPVGITEIKLEKLNIYPNPSNGVFVLNLGNQLKNVNNIEVINTFGQVVYQNRKPQLSELQIDLSQFSKGLYFVKVRNNDNEIINKIVVE
jgi:hypothetical protein